ncbi:MAG: YceI family protein [Muriicola sp.]|nr:YceI family protein [Muriicola sp.]NNK09790.1 YceI family protein [Flavobacteriaceae bacterium]
MAEIQFDASTPLEDIYAINKKVNLILRDDGEIAVLLLVKEFDFKRKLMQEHFNENYVESDKYPKAYFTGKIKSFSLDGLTAEPKSFVLSGELTLHGVTRPVETDVSISREEDTLNLRTVFITKTEDHEIKVPKILFMKVGKEVQVSVSAQLDKT